MEQILAVESEGFSLSTFNRGALPSASERRVQPIQRLRAAILPAAGGDLIVELLGAGESGQVEFQLGRAFEGDAHVF